jgi:hypothetical protein
VLDHAQPSWLTPNKNQGGARAPSRVAWSHRRHAQTGAKQLRMQETGMIKSSPQQIIAKGADWRFITELKRELKA